MANILNEIRSKLLGLSISFVDPPTLGDRTDENLSVFINMIVILSGVVLIYLIWLGLGGKGLVGTLKSVDILLALFIIGGIINLIRMIRIRNMYKIILSFGYFLIVYIAYKTLVFSIIG